MLCIFFCSMFITNPALMAKVLKYSGYICIEFIRKLIQFAASDLFIANDTILIC